VGTRAVAGPRRGHIWATNDRTAADNTGHYRSASAELTGQPPPGTAGHRGPRHSLTRKMSQQLPYPSPAARWSVGQAVQAPRNSVRAGSVPQRSSAGMGGHQRSPTVRRTRRSLALRLKQLG